MPAKQQLDWRSVAEQLIAGVALALLVPIGSAIWGVITGASFRLAMLRARDVLVASVNVPYWVIGLVFATAVPVGIAFIQRKRVPVPHALPKRPSLSHDEEAVMRVFGDNDRPEIPGAGLREYLGLTQLRYDEALASLSGRDFLYVSSDVAMNRHNLILQPAGRSWLLAAEAPNVR